jgi:hypothetical protein
MSEKPMFEDCTTGLTCSAIEAEMRDRLAAKDARIAELSSAVAGKVQLIEPDPETIAWAEGVFAAEDDKNATIEDLSRKLEASRHRVAELEEELKQERLWKLTPDEHRDYLEARYKSIAHDLELATEREAAKDARIAALEAGGREMWAVWNSCNGVFEVTNWRKDALDVIAEAYSEHETVVPVRVFVEDEDRHGLRHAHEDEREVLWRARSTLEGKQDATGQALVDLLQGSPLQDVKIERDAAQDDATAPEGSGGISRPKSD